MNKRKLTAMLTIIALVALLATGSLAYFNAEDSVTNTFMVAESDDPNVKLFAIEVNETTGTEYKDILPGDTRAKDPVVKNIGRYDQYVRVLVTVSDYAAWSQHLQSGATVNSLWDAPSGWTLDTAAPVVDAAADTITYTYYLNTVLQPNGTAALFTEVSIPGYLGLDAMTALSQFTISIKAQAIQTANTGDNAQAAFQLWGQ